MNNISTVRFYCNADSVFKVHSHKRVETLTRNYVAKRNGPFKNGLFP